jgi:hypothetical protein
MLSTDERIFMYLSCAVSNFLLRQHNKIHDEIYKINESKIKEKEKLPIIKSKGNNHQSTKLKGGNKEGKTPTGTSPRNRETCHSNGNALMQIYFMKI